jgi:hypothetical protein
MKFREKFVGRTSSFPVRTDMTSLVIPFFAASLQMRLRTDFPRPWHSYSHQTSVHGGYGPCFVQILYFRPAECLSQFSIFVLCFLDAFEKLRKRLFAPSGLSVCPFISLCV